MLVLRVPVTGSNRDLNESVATGGFAVTNARPAIRSNPTITSVLISLVSKSAPLYEPALCACEVTKAVLPYRRIVGFSEDILVCFRSPLAMTFRNLVRSMMLPSPLMIFQSADRYRSSSSTAFRASAEENAASNFVMSALPSVSALPCCEERDCGNGK
jgi:hypothetical protein